MLELLRDMSNGMTTQFERHALSGSNRLISRRGALDLQYGLLILCLLSMAINVAFGIKLVEIQHKAAVCQN